MKIYIIFVGQEGISLSEHQDSIISFAYKVPPPNSDFDKIRQNSTFSTFLDFLMCQSRCWWGRSNDFNKIGKTQHFSTFLNISRRIEVAARQGAS